jgi:hypothetical protein
LTWLILLVLVPVIVTVVVVLAGFAGCDRLFGLDQLDPPDTPAPPAPSELTATVVGRQRIDLSWNDNGSETTTFRITRKENGSAIEPIEDVQALMGTPPIANTYSDSPLNEGTTYEYQVFALAGSYESGGSNTASATTLSYLPAFTQGPTQTTGVDPGNFADFTIVQRLPAAILDRSGPAVRLWVRASQAADMQLSRVSFRGPPPREIRTIRRHPLLRCSFREQQGCS